MRLNRSIIVVSVIVVLAGIAAFKIWTLNDQTTTNEVVEVAPVQPVEKEPETKEPEPETFDVVVKFTGTELNGQIIAGLFDSEEGFGKREDPLQRRETKATPSGDAACEFTGLLPGTYVISAFQDSNGNSKLDKNGFGKPKEKYGFTNNARGRFGPPKYLDCKFEVSDASVIEIKLR